MFIIFNANNIPLECRLFQLQASLWNVEMEISKKQSDVPSHPYSFLDLNKLPVSSFFPRLKRWCWTITSSHLQVLTILS